MGVDPIIRTQCPWSGRHHGLRVTIGGFQSHRPRRASETKAGQWAQHSQMEENYDLVIPLDSGGFLGFENSSTLIRTQGDMMETPVLGFATDIQLGFDGVFVGFKMTGLNVESHGMLEIACIIIDGSVTQIKHKEDMEIAAVVSSAMTQVNNYAIIHTEAYIGRSKVESAAACRAINLTVKIMGHKEAFRSNALDIMSKYYIVVDATDNVPSRYMISDCCVVLSKPLISGAALELEGQLTVYNYNGGPCYQRLFPTPPPTTACQRCADSGVLGVVQVVEFVEKHVDVYEHTPLIAGSSIYMDLIFFKKYMPDLAAVFSQVVDVSSVKALCIPCYPKDNKEAPKEGNQTGSCG